MSKLDTALHSIQGTLGSQKKDRLLAELSYARRVSDVNGGKFDGLILEAVELVKAAVQRDGVLVDAVVPQVEAHLAPMGEACKKYRLICCGHAHIDMNWMWRYDETVQVALDTFHTVLNLMDEFPAFKFSQSQASVYRIVEEFDPPLLDKIAEKVREGRWEVIASTWVEADRNMPSQESVARHQLYTARYLPKLLGQPLNQNFDFEPDTFGHHANTPEMLSQAGVKYYYHCRGLDEYTLYRWQSPSGAEIISYRDPYWYLGEVSYSIGEYVPEFCEKFGTECALKVYGVGDHGGGPTRRDLERLTDMGTWPIFPRVEFGFYRDFYQAAEANRDKLPLVKGELNPVFVGCYTTQTRIKKGNRYGERLLSEAEALSAVGKLTANAPYRTAQFEEGWRNVLFNQFHDIIPGSGVIDTREYAMGLYSQTYAIANSAKRSAAYALAGAMDTSGLPNVSQGCGTISEGAGVGFRVEEAIALNPVDRGRGSNRIFHLFNPATVSFKGLVDLTIWDFKDDLARLAFTDASGKRARHQVLESGHNSFWGHDFTRVMLEAEVPAVGYATYSMQVDEDVNAPVRFFSDWQVERDEKWIIENELLKAECNPVDLEGTIVLTDKRTGAEHTIDGFSLAMEDPRRGMTAWVTGDELSVRPVSENLSIRRVDSGDLVNSLEISAPVGEKSKLSYTISLKAGSPVLEIEATCHWLEVGTNEKMPQLRFDLTPDTEDPDPEYVYDIPGGVTRRKSSAIDLPGLRFIATESCDGSVMLLSDSKYGYRGDRGMMGVTLMRSSIEPDPYPELGVHRVRLGVAVLDTRCPLAMVKLAKAFERPVTVLSGTNHEGKLPLSQSFVSLESGSVELTQVKLSEDGKALILRGSELTGEGKDVAIRLNLPVQSARFADTHEQPKGEALSVKDGLLSLDVKPYGMFTLRLEL